MKTLRRLGIPLVCVLLGVLLILFPPHRIASLDDVADSYFKSSITQATAAYGITRLINAGVSVIKESSVQLEPGGVGIAIAAGQVADPLDDITEHLSSILVTAIISLMVQKMGFEIAQVFVFQVIGFLLIMVAILSIFRQGVMLQYRNLSVKVILFLFVIRLFLPCSALISQHLNEDYFFPRIQERQVSLAPMIQEFRTVTDFELPEVKGIGDVFLGPGRLMGEKGSQINAALTMMVSNGIEIFNNMIEIMALYLGVFIIQVIFIPLFMFWLLNKLVYLLFSQSLPQSWFPKAFQTPANQGNTQSGEQE